MHGQTLLTGWSRYTPSPRTGNVYLLLLLLSGIPQVFVLEKQSEGGWYRSFAASSYNALWGRYHAMQPQERHFYEVASPDPAPQCDERLRIWCYVVFCMALEGRVQLTCMSMFVGLSTDVSF
jgi:hypothetical protein